MAAAYISEEQYLEIEESSEQKCEYFRGEMFPMEATLDHVMINDNLFLVLARELAGSGCRAFSNKMRLRISKTGTLRLSRYSGDLRQAGSFGER